MLEFYTYLVFWEIFSDITLLDNTRTGKFSMSGFRQCCKNDIFISYGTKNARLISSQTGAHNYELSARWSYEQFIINEFSSHDSNCLISRKFSSFAILNPDIVTYVTYPRNYELRKKQFLCNKQATSVFYLIETLLYH